jgi:hypothetical protein
MQAAGDVKSATVIRYPDGRSKGWGLVEFESSTGSQEAIASYNDRELMGRKIFIREDRETGEAGGLPPPGGAAADGSKGGGKGRGRGGRASRGSRARPPLEAPAEEATSGTALFVGNLPWSTTSQQLKEVSRLPFARSWHSFSPLSTARSHATTLMRFSSISPSLCASHPALRSSLSTTSRLPRSRPGMMAARVVTASSPSSRRRMPRLASSSVATTWTAARCWSDLTDRLTSRAGSGDGDAGGDEECGRASAARQVGFGC